MLFKKKGARGGPAQRELILKKAMKEIEKLLIELDSQGKDLRLIGLRELGFKVYVAESDAEDIFFTED